MQKYKTQRETPVRAIALGFFDGVHLGHKALMDRAVMRARQIGGTSAVFSFDRHPASVLTGQNVPLLTADADRREELCRLGGVDEVILGRFDHAMQQMDWRDFIHKLLIGKYNARYIISGHNNRFGYRGLGTPEGMAEECYKAGIGYDCIADVKVDGVVVSSTYIRGLIAAGEMERAAKFLGHPYTITGTVVHGRAVGRKLGVPTVNLRIPPEIAMPPFGIYATRVRVGDKSYLAATNIGVRPTFADSDEPTIEPHLLDFTGDLYGRVISVELHRFLREEKRFESPDALKEAIEADIAHTRAYFA
jgi:riboflavin kinase/FMN adenylyltransferase